MAMRIDSTLQSLPGRVQDYIKDDVASGRRSPYSEVAIPLNAALIARQERIDSQRAQIKSLEAAVQSQAERIKELERESETHAKAYGLAIVERDNLRHELKTAQEGWRCECSTDDACRFARERDALRAELDAIAATEPRAYEVYQKCSTKYSTLTYDTSKVPEVFVGGTVNPLFTRHMPSQRLTELKLLMLTTAYEQGVGKGIQRRDCNPYAADTDERTAWALGYEEGLDKPMPAQDVTELVEALERVLNCCDIAECSTVPNSPGALKNARTALANAKGAK